MSLLLRWERFAPGPVRGVEVSLKPRRIATPQAVSIPAPIQQSVQLPPQEENGPQIEGADAAPQVPQRVVGKRPGAAAPKPKPAKKAKATAPVGETADQPVPVPEPPKRKARAKPAPQPGYNWKKHFRPLPTLPPGVVLPDCGKCRNKNGSNLRDALSVARRLAILCPTLESLLGLRKTVLQRVD